jgi:hypothetical protein
MNVENLVMMFFLMRNPKKVPKIKIHLWKGQHTTYYQAAGGICKPKMKQIISSWNST